MRWLLVRRWLMLLAGFLALVASEVLLHRCLAAAGAKAALERLAQGAEALLSRLVSAGARALGLPLLLVVGVELFHFLSGGQAPHREAGGASGGAHHAHVPHMAQVAAHGGVCRYLSARPHWAAGALAAVAACWYCVISPPSFKAISSCVLTPIGVISSGLFVSKAQASDDAEIPWRFLAASVVCLYLSGSRSFVALMAFDFMVVASHGAKRLQHIYVLHETRRDFCERVQRALDMDGLHPAFIEDGFSSLVHTSLRAPLARKLSFAIQRTLSLGTQRRLLGQKYDSLMLKLESLHPRRRDSFLLEIDRADLLPSTFRAVQQAPREDLLALHLQVSFRAELGEDAGGLLRDWFDSIGRALLEDAAAPLQDAGRPRPLLVPHPEDCTLTLRPGSERWDDFFSLGRLMALALLHCVQLPIHFSSLSWKLLLGQPIAASDIESADPHFFRNRVAAVLRPGGVEEMAAILGEPLRFASAPGPLCAEEVELVPGGLLRLVTEDNKLEYVQRLCEFHICGQVQREWQLLRQGFQDLVPLDSLCSEKDLSGHDLELLVAGLPSIDVGDWMINTNVDGPLAGTEAGNLLCDWFWDVMQRFGAERRAKLLQFATGSSRVPCDGFRGLEPPFCLYLCAGPAERLPTASTCSNQLNLAPYTSRSMLIDRLRVICSAEASLGFGFV